MFSFSGVPELSHLCLPLLCTTAVLNTDLKKQDFLSEEKFIVYFLPKARKVTYFDNI